MVTVFLSLSLSLSKSFVRCDSFAALFSSRRERERKKEEEEEEEDSLFFSFSFVCVRKRVNVSHVVDDDGIHVVLHCSLRGESSRCRLR